MNFKQYCKNNLFRYSIIIFIIIITTISTRNFYLNKTSVSFVNLKDSINYKLDHKNKLFLVNSKYYNVKRSLNIISPGDHFIYYDTSPVTRYYADIKVEKGKNLIKPVFDFHSLPSLSIYKAYSNKALNKINNNKTANYISYTSNNTEINNTLKISIGLEIRKISKNYLYDFTWNVFLNDKSISQSHFTKTTKANNTIKIDKTLIIYKDSCHLYYARYNAHNGKAKLKIGSEYL